MDHSEREKIELYLLDKMDDAARQAFEQRMASDKELARKVKLEEEALQLLDAIGDQKMKARMDRIHEEVIGRSTPKNRVKSFLVPLVVFMAILGMVYYLMVYNSNSSAEPKVLYAQYYESYPISLANREEGDDLKIQQVNALYKNEEYQKVLPILDELILENSDAKLQIAAGISALQTGAYQKALSHFDLLIDNEDPLYINQAKWYAAMTALQLKNTSLATNYLQSLVDSDSNFKKQESLDVLDRLK